MLIPEVIGFKLHGRLPEGATATDLVLTVVQMLRKRALSRSSSSSLARAFRALSLADRATIGNMAPEYGATVGYFPIDDETLRYLTLTGRDPHLIKLVESYAKEQGMFRTDRPLIQCLLTRWNLTSPASCRASPARAGPRTGLR